MESVEDYEEKVIYVRTKKVGYLIGTSGRTIRGFETNSGAKIDILKPNSQYVEQDLYKKGKVQTKGHPHCQSLKVHTMARLSQPVLAD